MCECVRSVEVWAGQLWSNEADQRRHTAAGENDMHNYFGNSELKSGYSCLMQTLVEQFRSLWSVTPGTTDPNAPFGLVTLAPSGTEGICFLWSACVQPCITSPPLFFSFFSPLLLRACVWPWVGRSWTMDCPGGNVPRHRLRVWCSGGCRAVGSVRKFDWSMCWLFPSFFVLLFGPFRWPVPEDVSRHTSGNRGWSLHQVGMLGAGSQQLALALCRSLLRSASVNCFCCLFLESLFDPMHWRPR